MEILPEYFPSYLNALSEKFWHTNVHRMNSLFGNGHCESPDVNISLLSVSAIIPEPKEEEESGWNGEKI